MKKTLLLIFLCLTGIRLMAQTATIEVHDYDGLKTALEDQGRTAAVRIVLAADFNNSVPLGATINWSVNGGHDVTLVGNNKELVTNGAYRHFNITNSGSGGIAFIEDIILSGSDAGGGIVFSTPVTIRNSTLRNNLSGGHGGAINGGSDLNVENCTFYQNTVNGSNYGGGAIGFVWYSGRVNISRSVFIENVGGTKGGAFSIHQGNGAYVTIKSCYFEGNSLMHPSAWADGGAINIYGNDQEHVILHINDCTFANNEAADDGGAMLIQNVGDNAVTAITNCTMFGNIAGNYEDSNGNANTYESGGGAVQVAVKTNAIFQNNTIVRNTSKLPGAGVGVHSSGSTIPTLHLDNNIILGNVSTSGPHQFGNNIEAKSSDGVTDLVITGNGNLGIDNMQALDEHVTLLNVFGTNSPELQINEQDKIGKVGNPNEAFMNDDFYRYIPTLVIIPNDGLAAPGLANGEGEYLGLDKDQQGFERNTNTPDVGAVEIVWVRFDANGGYWKESDDYTSSSDYYYTRDNEDKVGYYFDIIRNDGVNTAVQPANPFPPIGYYGTSIWVLDDGSNTPWDFATPVTENIKLKALWQAASPTHKVTYMVDGSDIQNFPDPAEYDVAEGATYTVVNPDPTRNNYIFLGWEATSTAVIEDGTPSGLNELYKADDTFTMPAADVVLTAQWQDNTPPPDPEPEPEPPVLVWSVSTTSSDPASFADVANDTDTEVEEGTPVYLQIRPVVSEDITFDSWSIDYTAIPVDYEYGMSPVDAASRYNFNEGNAHELPGDYIYTVNRLVLYANGFQVGSYNYSRSDIRHTIRITEKTDPDPEPDPDPWPPVLPPDPIPDPDPNPDAWIFVRPLAPLCKTEQEFRIPFTRLYTEEQLEYTIAFPDAAKEAGFKDISTYRLLPEENYISVTVDSPITPGSYYGYVIVRIKGTKEIDLFPFRIIVQETVRIVKHPESVGSRCEGDGFMLTVEATGENLTYQWYLNDKEIEGAVADTYEAALTSSTQGSYYVIVGSDCGTEVSEPATVSLNQVKVLIKWDDVLYVTNTDNKYTSFQWYKDGQEITLNGKSIYYTHPDGLNGSYYVRAYKADGSYDESCTIEFSVTTRSASLAIYPTLVSRFEHITIESNGIDNSYDGAKIDIYDMNGRKVLTMKSMGDRTIVPVDFSPGTYIIHITATNGKVKTEKITVK